MWSSSVIVFGILMGIYLVPCKFCTVMGDELKTCGNPPLSCNPTQPYRSIDGSCNNLKHITRGMAVTPYRRVTPSSYSDGIFEVPKSTTGEQLPLARDLSNELHPVGNILELAHTRGFVQFGQIIAHDMALTLFLSTIGNPPVECCTTDGMIGKDDSNPRCLTIYIRDNDPVFSLKNIQCFDFERTGTTMDLGCSTAEQPAEPITTVTAFADLSVVYGSEDELARSLRTLSGGLLRTLKRHGQTWPPQVANNTEVCAFVTSPEDPCYQTGDTRANQNPDITSLQILFLRQHNRIAKKLANINPHWGDEQLYQEARRINIAMYQHIVYYEYVPRIIGRKHAENFKVIYRNNAYGCIPDYNPHVDPSVVVEFSTGAFRGLHSQIIGVLHLMDEYRNVVDKLRLSSNLNKPKVLEMNNTTRSNNCDLNYDYVIRGMSYQPPKRNDETFDIEVKQFLFRVQRTLGVDLRAFDIQRGRDHGVGKYIDALKFCKQLLPRNFEDLQKLIPSKSVQLLKRMYNDVRDIELSVGGVLERVAPEALVGPTFQCLIATQFYRTRVGDRFFYENCLVGAFNLVQLREIRKASFACLLCENSFCVKKMQPQAFDRLDYYQNPLTSCDKLCTMDFSQWREDFHRTYNGKAPFTG